MKNILCGLIFLLLIAPAANAQDKKAGGLPPLIDRELIFGNPEIAGAQLSPNGQYLAFLKPWKDTRNVYVKAVAEPFSAARLLTTESKRPVAGFFWTRDSKYILYVKDHDGDENYNVGCSAFARPDRVEGRARGAVRSTEERPRRCVYRIERSRQSLA
jgi:hypothetical protein